MKSLHAPAALFADGWGTDVTIVIGDEGCIKRISRGVPDGDAERLAGPVIAAMPNLHSHAFQRAIAGRTGTPSPHHDDTFWTWREAMYRAVNMLDPDLFEAIAAQAYVEMAKAGYASVAEFHYVHHDPRGNPYDDRAELAWRIVAAARTAGLGLTLLPVFYAQGNFGNAAPSALQRRFIHTFASFERLYADLKNREDTHGYVLGVAPHSLRAVSAEDLGRVVRLASDDAPIHIHAAEQTREVDDCYAATRMRPVEWLLTQADVGERWCIVHATHMTDREVTGLAGSGAVVGLAPTTEADLGDGIFRGESYFQAGGRFGVGTDSNAVIDPFAELRQLEWSQRLRLRRRNVMAGTSQLPVGQTLWRAAVRGGAQAIGRTTGTIAPGMRADLIVLDGEHPALLAQPLERILDAALFGPCRQPVRDVMSRGQWIVREGRHPQEDAVLHRYRDALARIDA